jgi:hypothetical protein
MPGTGNDKSADKAIDKAAADLPAGTYTVTVTGQVTTKGGKRPQPTPIGDYKADVS